MTKTHLMTVAEGPCANLPLCRRRFGIINGKVICKPPSYARLLPPAQFLSDKSNFNPRELDCTACIGCREVEVPAEGETPYKSSMTLAEFGTKMPPSELPILHSDGIIEYTPRSFEPPPLPFGYERLSNDPKSEDAWKFKPIEGLCKFIEMRITEIVSPCGCRRVAAVCIKESPHKQLTDGVCDTCPLRGKLNE